MRRRRLTVEPRTLLWASVGGLIVALLVLGHTWQENKKNEQLPLETLTVVAARDIVEQARAEEAGTR